VAGGENPAEKPKPRKNSRRGGGKRRRNELSFKGTRVGKGQGRGGNKKRKLRGVGGRTSDFLTIKRG